MTVLCVDPVTIGFDLTLAEYAAAAGEAGFTVVEWPVIWARPDLDGGYASARATFTTAGVRPLQFTCGLGVPGNLAVAEPVFRKRLTEFAAYCRAGRAVDSCRAAAFFDEDSHGGGILPEHVIIERVIAVAAVAADQGVRVVIGWHGRRLLSLCGNVHRASAGAAGLIMDTFTLARHGLGADFIRSLPDSSIEWVRVGDAVTADGFTRRMAPGTGTIDIAETVRACRDNGYAGPLSIEVNDAPTGLDARHRARRAYLSLEGIDL